MVRKISELGRGYDLIVIKKEEDGIYWGSSKGLLIKFPSNQELKIGQTHFVGHRSVIEKKLPDGAIKGFKEKINFK